MAIVTFNKKGFEKEIGKIDEKMQEKIALFGTPVESVSDNEIQIEVEPNRPDLLSYQGFKRSFLAYLNRKRGLKEYKVYKPEKNYKVIIEDSVKDVRPYTACAIIKNLKLNDTKIKDMVEVQEKIHGTFGRNRKKVAIGIYPLEKIKLPITFKALEPDKIKFIPLESNTEMSGFEILQRHPAGKEYAHLLSGKLKFPIFVDANNEILSMPPVINSQLTGKVTEKTKDIFVECSGFDMDILKKCLNMLVTIFADMGGTIYQMDLKFKRARNQTTPDLKPEEMKISIENTNKLLGLNLKEKQIKLFLERMGYDYYKGSVKIPAWRTDILHEVDLIEDVAIAYGFDNFIPEIPEISTIGEESQKEVFKRKISEILSGVGMLETSNYHLTKKKLQFEKMGTPENNFVELEESKTDYNILRKDLTHYLLKILFENSDSEYPQKIFEIGKIFEQEAEIIEKENLALAIAPGNYTETRQILEYLGKMLNLFFEIKETGNIPSYFIDGRTAEIFLNENSVGFMGEIHPKILKNWRIKMPVSILEISLKDILKD